MIGVYIRSVVRPFQIQRQQPRQNLLVAQIVRPAVGVEDGSVEPLVRGVQPRRPRIVEVGEGAFLQLSFGQAGRVEPGVALFDEVPGRGGDGLHARIVLRLPARRPGNAERSTKTERVPSEALLHLLHRFTMNLLPNIILIDMTISNRFDNLLTNDRFLNSPQLS